MSRFVSTLLGATIIFTPKLLFKRMPLRRATFADLVDIQQTNLKCLPENYPLRYYFYHYLSWPHLLWVETDYNGKIVGYVLAKMEEDTDDGSPRRTSLSEPSEEVSSTHGHVTSLAVLHSQRRLGIATELMRAVQESMSSLYDADYVALHVRVSNRAALRLYQDTLGFRVKDVEKHYYADQEDAYEMRKWFQSYARHRAGQMRYATDDGRLIPVT